MRTQSLNPFATARSNSLVGKSPEKSQTLNNERLKLTDILEANKVFMKPVPTNKEPFVAARL